VTLPGVLLNDKANLFLHVNAYFIAESTTTPHETFFEIPLDSIQELRILPLDESVDALPSSLIADPVFLQHNDFRSLRLLKARYN